MKKYENIDVNKFASEVFMQFYIYLRDDNSLMMMRKSTDDPVVVVVIRTSTNHYVITGTKKEFTKTGYGKTVKEVSDFILRNFCITLFDTVRGINK